MKVMIVNELMTCDVLPVAMFVYQVIHEIQVMMNTGLQVILDSVYKYTHLSVDCLQIQSLFFPEFGKLTPVSFFPVSRFFSHLHDLDSKRVCF